jgi:hypothetical protein
MKETKRQEQTELARKYPQLDEVISKITVFSHFPPKRQ